MAQAPHSHAPNIQDERRRCPLIHRATYAGGQEPDGAKRPPPRREKTQEQSRQPIENKG